jgi:hypothetical protein
MYTIATISRPLPGDRMKEEFSKKDSRVSRSKLPPGKGMKHAWLNESNSTELLLSKMVSTFSV